MNFIYNLCKFCSWLLYNFEISEIKVLLHIEIASYLHTSVINNNDCFCIHWVTLMLLLPSHSIATVPHKCAMLKKKKKNTHKKVNNNNK